MNKVPIPPQWAGSIFVDQTEHTVVIDGHFDAEDLRALREWLNEVLS